MSELAALYDEADKLKDEGKYDEAIAKLKELVAKDEAYTLAHLALAVLYGKTGEHELAVQHGRRACELEPDQAFNFTALSVTCQRAFAGTQNQQYIGLAEDALAKANALQYRR